MSEFERVYSGFVSVYVCTVLEQTLVCLCLLACVCASVPFCVSEPTPWISGVGHGREEQSRIKSILTPASREPVLLLGDTATEREEKREQTLLLLLLLLSSLLSHSVVPSSCPCFFFIFFFFSSLHLTLSLFSFFRSLPCLMLPFLPLSLSTVSAPYLSLLSPSVSAPQRGVIGTGEWRTIVCEVQGRFEILAGSMRFIKRTFFMK